MATDTLTMARSTLLDALAALNAHRRAVIVVGAQAIYLHTGSAQVALAEATKDSDLALDVRRLDESPRIEEAMRAAGFQLSTDRPQPGTWLGRNGIPVDLMVPESLAGVGGRRGARIPPHARNAARRVTKQAMRFLADMFAAGADATGSVMAGRAEEGIGDPAFVAAAVSALANDLLNALRIVP